MALTAVIAVIAVIDLEIIDRMHDRGGCCVLMPRAVVRTDKPRHRLQRQQKTQEQGGETMHAADFSRVMNRERFNLCGFRGG
jgi:hypothetical protein